MPHLLGFSGSLRAASSATALLRALIARLEGKAEVEIADIASLPHYNADHDGGAAVAALLAAIERADGLVFVTPEYNYSVPGVLKNAIDWASRPAYQSVLKGKPAFVATVSGGLIGGARAQAHLKYVLNAVLAEVYPCQEVVVPQAPAKIVDGVFADAAVLDFAGAALDGFLARIAATRGR
ncbi:NADPH-dependent FMN reductase [Polymorphum gilvum]|uniref:Putative chromate reductase n=1 Tax=Polymorphum gilvum (strain LMG 25793 / CGMCC 1.9160 / SL003B-26A1) TaxID=991905 RepID=F2J2I7_POLGS|nr:NAD(P)H-dependent oxidoreductase [Polymorphum gilvum]ADZ70901.1 Putative chromate reductase [Polymorphum gilvum SL003B-26A1]